MKRKLIITSSIALLIITGVAIWLAQRGSVVDPNIQPQPAGLDDHSGQTRSSLNQRPPDQSASRDSDVARARSLARIEDMKRLEADISEVLKSASDDATGKRSPWFEPHKTWQQLLGKAAQSGKREDLFALVPIAASFYARDQDDEFLVKSIDDLTFRMGALGYDMITELGKAVAENHGALDERTGSIAVTIFAVKGIQSDPWPEDETPPIDPAGVLIARPEVMQLLEKLPPNN